MHLRLILRLTLCDRYSLLHDYLISYRIFDVHSIPLFLPLVWESF